MTFAGSRGSFCCALSIALMLCNYRVIHAIFVWRSKYQEEFVCVPIFAYMGIQQDDGNILNKTNDQIIHTNI